MIVVWQEMGKACAWNQSRLDKVMLGKYYYNDTFVRYALPLNYGSNELTRGGDICNGKRFCGWFLLRGYENNILVTRCLIMFFKRKRYVNPVYIDVYM